MKNYIILNIILKNIFLVLLGYGVYALLLSFMLELKPDYVVDSFIFYFLNIIWTMYITTKTGLELEQK